MRALALVGGSKPNELGNRLSISSWMPPPHRRSAGVGAVIVKWEMENEDPGAVEVHKPLTPRFRR